VCFRRQLPIGNYIADFAAPAAKLVVEVDGAHYARRQTVAETWQRDGEARLQRGNGAARVTR
jgi:very-short-patch-repair endonuclease